jgi:hypothetical protein
MHRHRDGTDMVRVIDIFLKHLVENGSKIQFSLLIKENESPQRRTTG